MAERKFSDLFKRKNKGERSNIDESKQEIAQEIDAGKIKGESVEYKTDDIPGKEKEEISENMVKFLSLYEREEFETARMYSQLWKTVDEPIATREELTPERKAIQFENFMNKSFICSEKGYLDVEIKKDGNVDIYNRETEKKSKLHIDFATGRTTYDATSKDAKTVSDAYEFCAIQKQGIFAIPTEDKIKEELVKSMEEAKNAPDGKSSFSIGNTEYTITARDNSYSITAAEVARHNTISTVIHGKELTEKEITSEKSIETIEKSAGTALTMRADRFAVQENELIQTRGEVVHSDPDQYVTRESNGHENKYTLNDPEHASYSSGSMGEVIDQSAAIDETREVNDVAIGGHADDGGFTSYWGDDDREEDDPYGERSLF